jgi:hypothetical protein
LVTFAGAGRFSATVASQNSAGQAGRARDSNESRLSSRRDLSRLRGRAGVFELLHRLGAVVFRKHCVGRIGRNGRIAVINEGLDVERERALPNIASIDLMARYGPFEIGLEFIHRRGTELDVRHIGRCDYRSEKQGGKHGDRPLDEGVGLRVGKRCEPRFRSEVQQAWRSLCHVQQLFARRLWLICASRSISTSSRPFFMDRRGECIGAASFRIGPGARKNPCGEGPSPSRQASKKR